VKRGYTNLEVETPVVLGAFYQVTQHQPILQISSSMRTLARRSIKLVIVLRMIHAVRPRSDIKAG
jgi:hypothetical protein